MLTNNIMSVWKKFSSFQSSLKISSEIGDHIRCVRTFVWEFSRSDFVWSRVSVRKFSEKFIFSWRADFSRPAALAYCSRKSGPVSFLFREEVSWWWKLVKKSGKFRAAISNSLKCNRSMAELGIFVMSLEALLIIKSDKTDSYSHEKDSFSRFKLKFIAN